MYLTYVAQNFEALGQQAAREQSSHVDYLAQLIDGEHGRRDDRGTERRVMAARFPVLKTLEQFDWSWPTNVNQMQIRHLFRLGFLKDEGNVIFIGTVGLGKTHLATALAHTACLAGHSFPAGDSIRPARHFIIFSNRPRSAAKNSASYKDFILHNKG